MKYGIYYAYWEQEWKADYIRYIEKVAKTTRAAQSADFTERQKLRKFILPPPASIAKK